ncbi:rab-GTPase-TBC domain-containing protein [Mycena crocata]|nr:rab-GTPase-TBC domain-containing protein [Mycena crocata]
MPSPSLPLKHPPYVSPGSKTSLVPSEGEDLDGFHVRNTYAQLEMSGVKGDGYEEGVERTRARIGASRASQLFAEGAVGDGTEKSQELDPKEIQTLVAVDRYGFFSTPSHDRLVLLPSAPLLKRLAVTRAGPSTTKPSAKSLSVVPPAPLPLKEAARIAKWTRMMEPLARDQGANVQTWRVKSSKQGKLRLRTYKGIPDRWRPAAWDMFMNHVAQTSSADMAHLGAQYRDAMDKPSTYDIQIDLDVPRTISGHIMFRTRYGAGQRSLFHVLHCFSLRCTECGYVQGMGPIAATLLCYFEPEKVYASLVRLHDAYAMHTIFSPGFPGLLEAIYVQERITEQMMPEVYAAFQKHTISTTSYATKWYITLFSNSVPFQTQLRLWDAFLLEGTDLFIAVAVAIVWAYRDHITSAAANFETILSLLSSFFVPEDEDSLLLWIEKTLGDKKLRSSISRWRADWKELVAAGKEATALL